ncbi:macro domain-containing protein [Amycolatopsis sp. cmx-4-54]|uniref:macro domain-containing protein n=1 Tax=Amycolatopsis sp. cmx-4-54 TaxID=2790936 RepID=UPI00397BF482
MPLEYVTGDATRPGAPGNKVIGHVCNDRGGWGRGFVLAVSRRWPQPEHHYRQWSRTSGFELGAVQLVQVETDTWVANLVAQHGYRTRENPVPLRYEALDTCLATLADHVVELDATVHLPRIGTGLAGGSWDKIATLLDRQLTAREISTTIYDLP